MTSSIARRLRRLEQPSQGNIGVWLIATCRFLEAEEKGAEATEIERLRREYRRDCHQAACRATPAAFARRQADVVRERCGKLDPKVLSVRHAGEAIGGSASRLWASRPRA